MVKGGTSLTLASLMLLVGVAGALAAPQPAVHVTSYSRSVTAGQSVTLAALVQGPAKRCTGTLSAGTSATQRTSAVSRHHVSFTWPTPSSTATIQATATVSCPGVRAASVHVLIRGDVIPASVTVGKSGFSSTTYDFTTHRPIEYGVVLTNPSPDQDALQVQVTVNLLSAGGQIVATGVGTVGDIPAGTTYFYGGLSEGSTVNPAPATMQVTTLVGQTQRAAHLPPIVVTNLHVIPDDLGNAEVQGQLSNPLSQTLPDYTTVSYVIFDAGGNVISGGQTFLRAEVPPGGQIGFDDTDYTLQASSVGAVSASVSPMQP